MGRNEKRLNEVVQEIQKAGNKAHGIVADVTKDAERIIEETIKYYGQLDVLVNNAGIFSMNNAAEIQIDEFDRIFNTNVRSVVALTKLAVPHLEKTKGNIVNVSSLLGLRASSNYLAYCMSKSALDQFTKCAALDLASRGIRVNALNPGLIKTPIFETSGMPSNAVEQFYQLYENKFPVGRLGEVQDTSAAIAYLASEQASFVTGILFSVDGGPSLSPLT